MKVGIIDYNAGNVYSVIHAVRRMGHKVLFTDSVKELSQCDAILFPGQGEASGAMSHLRRRGLDKFILETKQPLLGICIGMQLLCMSSEENNTDCLGIFDVPVVKFVPQLQNQKVPHMGWNKLETLSSKQFDTSLDGDFAYFVHSYYVPLCEWTSSVSDYIQPFSSALQRNNYYAVQFHPEKSGKVGEEILKNFFDRIE